MSSDGGPDEWQAGLVLCREVFGHAELPFGHAATEHVRQNAYDVVTDRVLPLLERGAVPWRRTWSTAVDAPRNLQGRQYRGINTWLLGGRGCGSPHWLTWKQIHEHCGRVLKGERSTPVVFWKQIEVDEDGEMRRVPIAPVVDLDEPSLPAVLGRGPEETR